MRLLTANVRGWPGMRASRARACYVAVRDLAPDVGALQEAWWPRYRRSIRRVFAAWGTRVPTWRVGSGGTATVWDNDRLHARQSGRWRLHGLTVAPSGTRDLQWVRLDDGRRHRIAWGSAHLTPAAFSHRLSGWRRASVRRKWEGGAARLVEWVEHELAVGSTHVAFGIDANCDRPQLVDALGTHIAGRPVRVLTSPGHPDHIVLVGRWRVHRSGQHPSPYSDHPVWCVDADPLP